MQQYYPRSFLAKADFQWEVSPNILYTIYNVTMFTKCIIKMIQRKSNQSLRSTQNSLLGNQKGGQAL